jgi:hypothetical protein
MAGIAALYGSTNIVPWDPVQYVESSSTGTLGTNAGGLWAAAVSSSLDTGSSSGSNTSTVFNCSGKSYTNDQYRGYSIYITADSGNPSAVGQSQQIITNGSTAIVVKQWQNSQTPSSSATYNIFDPVANGDGVHPATSGCMKMSAGCIIPTNH